MLRDLASMIWVEWRKVIRSGLLVWTALASLFMPAGTAFLIFIARNPELSRQLGVVSAKADLVAYAATDWATYLVLFAQVVAMGGFFFFVLANSWVFGREFENGTLKDMLAVPMPRASILLAKFIVVVACAGIITLVVIAFGLLMGAIMRLPGGSPQVILQGSLTALVAACLAIAGVLPFALLASVGRGYLLPMGSAVLALISANLIVLLGWGEYFPWSVPMLYAQGESALGALSYWIVLLTSLAGVAGTIAWWQRADLP